MASPLDIIIEASNGASDYGNKFGEPVISGFARSFGLTSFNGERREWIKPIMFSGGLGTVDADMTEKLLPEKGKWYSHYVVTTVWSTEGTNQLGSINLFLQEWKWSKLAVQFTESAWAAVPRVLSR